MGSHIEHQAALHGRAWSAALYRVTCSPHEWTDEDSRAMAEFILAGTPPPEKHETPIERKPDTYADNPLYGSF